MNKKNKLTKEQAESLRQRAFKGEKVAALAAEYGVSENTVRYHKLMERARRGYE